jgi:hypothetical protein
MPPANAILITVNMSACVELDGLVYGSRWPRKVY